MKTWVIADTHFGHAGVCRFLNEDGSKLRPWDNPADMDEAMVSNWNACVAPDDRVYLLGDAAINRRSLPTLGRLAGRKVLVKGNHDIFRLEEYTPYFDDIRAYVVINPNKQQSGSGAVLSHIPIHPESIGRYGLNIHGHLHSRQLDDPRYICVSAEHTGFSPVHLDAVLRWREAERIRFKPDGENIMF